jgi:threonine/homoserine/homoserine lactone efflux protein
LVTCPSLEPWPRLRRCATKALHEHGVPADDARHRRHARHRRPRWGSCPHLLAAITGLAALLRAGGPAFEALRYAGAMLRLFFFAFLPQFVDEGSGASLRILELSGVFMLVTFVVFAGYGLGAAAVRERVVARPRVTVWVRRIFGGAFVALAGRLAVIER